MDLGIPVDACVELDTDTRLQVELEAQISLL
jgi:hypothetical protein